MSRGEDRSNRRVPRLRLMSGGKRMQRAREPVGMRCNGHAWALRDRLCFRIDEVAEIIGAREETIRKWIRKGELKAYVLPEGHIVVLREDLIAFLTRRAA